MRKLLIETFRTRKCSSEYTEPKKVEEAHFDPMTKENQVKEVVTKKVIIMKKRARMKKIARS